MKQFVWRDAKDLKDMPIRTIILFKRPELTNFKNPLSSRGIWRKEFMDEWESGGNQRGCPAIDLVKRESHKIRNGSNTMIRHLSVNFGVEGEL